MDPEASTCLYKATKAHKLQQCSNRRKKKVKLSRPDQIAILPAQCARKT